MYVPIPVCTHICISMYNHIGLCINKYRFTLISLIHSPLVYLQSLTPTVGNLDLSICQFFFFFNFHFSVRINIQYYFIYFSGCHSFDCLILVNIHSYIRIVNPLSYGTLYKLKYRSYIQLVYLALVLHI